jgi:hypothetical protein
MRISPTPFGMALPREIRGHVPHALFCCFYTLMHRRAFTGEKVIGRDPGQDVWLSGIRLTDSTAV